MQPVQMTYHSDHGESLSRRWWQGRSFLQQRLIRLCVSILVMVLCFPLYYLGFFGTVDGPLHPSRVGDSLAGLGVTQTHCLMFFLSVLIIAISWNWIFNRVSLWTGARLTCKRAIDDDGTLCGEAVQRHRGVSKRSGQPVVQYVCCHGHKRPDAHFHPVAKGTISHTLWVLSLCFSLIVLFMS